MKVIIDSDFQEKLLYHFRLRHNGGRTCQVRNEQENILPFLGYVSSLLFLVIFNIPGYLFIFDIMAIVDLDNLKQ